MIAPSPNYEPFTWTDPTQKWVCQYILNHLWFKLLVCRFWPRPLWLAWFPAPVLHPSDRQENKGQYFCLGVFRFVPWAPRTIWSHLPGFSEAHFAFLFIGPCQSFGLWACWWWSFGCHTGAVRRCCHPSELDFRLSVFLTPPWAWQFQGLFVPKLRSEPQSQLSTSLGSYWLAPKHPGSSTFLDQSRFWRFHAPYLLWLVRPKGG